MNPDYITFGTPLKVPDVSLYTDLSRDADPWLIWFRLKAPRRYWSAE